MADQGTRGNVGEILGDFWGMLGEILGESAVDNYIIWRMSGTTSGVYCQQLIAIHVATCICDAVFMVLIGLYFQLHSSYIEDAFQ